MTYTIRDLSEINANPRMKRKRNNNNEKYFLTFRLDARSGTATVTDTSRYARPRQKISFVMQIRQRFKY